MENWKIIDYERRCFNLLTKLGRTNADKPHSTEKEIRATVKQIMKDKKCDKLTALKNYKAILFNELMGAKQ